MPLSRQSRRRASAKVADVSGTAATEAAAGALSRALCSAEVQGPGWVRDAVSPVWLAQVGAFRW